MTRHGWVGVDEAGRGPLAGPVYAGAVILDPQDPIAGLADSKTLTERRREALYEDIRARALYVGVGRAEVNEIDSMNILQASYLAMHRAIKDLGIRPEGAQIDGRYVPNWDLPCEAIVKGDSKIPAISAASIIAKVLRDRVMLELDREFPEYGFAKHKGYPTKDHLRALAMHGITPHHRKSYAPVKRLIRAEELGS